MVTLGQKHSIIFNHPIIGMNQSIDTRSILHFHTIFNNTDN